MRFIYLRHLRYRGTRVGNLRGYYPARSTPFRENPNSQGKQYR
ncbi:IncP-type conjugative transfer protein TrbD [Methylomonas fluvii]|nr:IncP-type conjugative transfer protein TrbD [Methylomonas fluvii]